LPKGNRSRSLHDGGTEGEGVGGQEFAEKSRREGHFAVRVASPPRLTQEGEKRSQSGKRSANKIRKKQFVFKGRSSQTENSTSTHFAIRESSKREQMQAKQKARTAPREAESATGGTPHKKGKNRHQGSKRTQELKWKEIGGSHRRHQKGEDLQE